MKRLVILISAALLAGPTFAQMNMKDMDMKSETKAGKGGKGSVHKATGVVTKVDPKAGKVTIKHGPVQSLEWPGMTMGFKVKDRALLNKLPKDKKVDFEFVQQGNDYVVTAVK